MVILVKYRQKNQDLSRDAKDLKDRMWERKQDANLIISKPQY